MGKHAEYGPVRRVQAASPRGPMGLAMVGGGTALALDDDYTSLLSKADLQGLDDSSRLVEGFPHIRDQCQLIANVGARMLDWNVPGGAAPGRPIDSLTAPAGYTYFGQFIAHDLSFAAERFPRRGGAATSQSGDNLRSAPLCLETIYGGGPKHFPLAYVCPLGGAAGLRRTERTHFRLGLRRVSAGAQVSDLPRLACPELAGIDGVSANKPRGATDVLIPDGRNDDHALISQLTTLFLRSHNRIADAILSAGSPAGTAEFGYHQVFERARAANVHIFRTIVWNDYLRRILDPNVFARYAPAGGPTDTIRFVTSPDVHRMPVEFSHAAFRFGHAMVKPSYRLGIFQHFQLDQILQRSSATRPDLMPFDETWLIDWHRFFGGKPGDSTLDFMFSRPLGPTVTPMGPDTIFVGPDDLPLPVSVVKSGRTVPAGGIATRDLARAYSVPMAPVADIIAVMKRDEALRAIVDAQPLLADDAHRAEAVRRWLDAPGIGEAPKDVSFSAPEIAFLTHCPPLFLFVLFEAEQIGGGARLGPVGSFIVAETLFARLVAGPGFTAIKAGQPYSSQVLTVPPRAVDRDVRRAFDGVIPSTMPDLIRLLNA